jgi:ATP-dependent exoDNAse (exonuclease V) alpha subunit
MILGRIRETRDDEAEAAVAGQSINDLPEHSWPACMGERGTFMAPFAYYRRLTHPFSKHGNLFAHLLPFDMQYAPYTASAVPFRWMMRSEASVLAEQYGLDYDSEREPTEPDWLKNLTWVQHHENQRAMLDGFFSAIRPDLSLCFFYAKQTPLSDDDGWVLVGAGRVKHIAPLQEFASSESGIRAYIWEHPIQHSLRHTDFQDGFLLPYHAILAAAEADHSINPADYVASIPQDRSAEFAYVTEHVTHDGAIAALLECKRVWEQCRTIVDAPCDDALTWIDARLAELWTLRGPYPGLGSALHAFGVPHGNFLAYELASHLTENEDPWPLVDQVFTDPSFLSPALARQLDSTLCRTWRHIVTKKPERLALLKLLARMEITAEQATRFYVAEEREPAGITCTDSDLLNNPYLLYELDRPHLDTISLWTVDRGVLPSPVIADKHPLPAPSAPEGATDPRRIRALTVSILDNAAAEGHTLLARDEVVRRIRGLPLEPACPVNGQMLEVIADSLEPAIHLCQIQNGTPAYQLNYLASFGKLIRSTVEKRLKAPRHTLDVDWQQRLDDKLGAYTSDDEQEAYAREEKTAALKHLAESRVSVLIGPAGTGKTTLLSVLCNEPAIAQGGVLLLAPTGKARVKLHQSTGLPAQTLAQFLLPLDRYVGETGIYRRSSREKIDTHKTVIVDEASMLTEEQLGALLDGIKGYDRLILVGDPRQLPPIGAGRPFLDIVTRIAPDHVETLFPRVGPGYAELTIRRRFKDKQRQDDMALEDVQLAEWFSGRPLNPGEDEIISRILSDDTAGRVRFVQWEHVDDLPDLLVQVLAEELESIEDRDDQQGFACSLGGKESKGYVYFNPDAAEQVENWQILSPVRGMPYGVRDINRLVQRHFRDDMLELARDSRKQPAWKKMWRITEPRGSEEIVYGDKVINVTNHRRHKVYPKDGALGYIANGEIGIVTGQTKRATDTWKGRPWLTKVTFSSQKQHTYDFTAGDFSEEGLSQLELAYAITVHKAQGSEFGICFLILPHPCRLLSRELLYTAFTRQRERIVVLHQCECAELKKYASAEYSVTAQRWTNLFAPPAPVQINETLLDDRMIHRSGKGEPMRSKSEVIIADSLAAAEVDYVYEQPLDGADGHTRYPDFTIDDADQGITYYWEHCGLLTNPHYRQRWERKLAWYRAQDILPYDEGGGTKGTLIVTKDEPNGGMNSQQIKALIDDIFA